jgi:hypothetical protein
MQVQAIATVVSGQQSVPQVDVTPIATLYSSGTLLSVSAEGLVAVAAPPADHQIGTQGASISVLEHVTGTHIRVNPLHIHVASTEVRPAGFESSHNSFLDQSAPPCALGNACLASARHQH